MFAMSADCENPSFVKEEHLEEKPVDVDVNSVKSEPSDRPSSTASPTSSHAPSSATPPISSIAHSILSADHRSDSDSSEVPIETPNDAPIHDVRCGTLNARLHMQRFTCPGIHRRCIEFNGEMITPREFTIKAEKDKQKDWKGSIRFGRFNLRTMMESKGLDFYHHETNCSLKCQSRNYIKNRKSEALESGYSLLESMVPKTESRNSSNCDHNDENGDFLSRKRSSVLDDYVSQTIQSLNGNPLSRFIKEDAPIKEDPHFFNGNVSGTNSTTTTVSSPSNHNMITQVTDNITPPDANQLILQQLLEQQKLIQQTPQQPQQLLQQLAQTIQKAQNPQDANALFQISTVLMQMNQQQQYPQPNNLNLLEQCILQQSLNNFNNNQAFQQVPQMPYINENTFSVEAIRKVMSDEPQLFWSRMKDLGCLDDLLDLISSAITKIRGLYSKRDSTSQEEEFGKYFIIDYCSLNCKNFYFLLYPD